MNDDMILICREVCRSTGKIAVYPLLDTKPTDRNLWALQLRSRANPELTYYATLKIRWDSSKLRDDIISVLKRKSLSDKSLERLGGIASI